MSLEVNMNKQTKPKRPVYNLEFKQDAAKLVIEKGYTHQQVADNLGVSLSAIVYLSFRSLIPRIKSTGTDPHDST
jgi:transposase